MKRTEIIWSTIIIILLILFIIITTNYLINVEESITYGLCLELNKPIILFIFSNEFICQHEYNRRIESIEFENKLNTYSLGDECK